MPYAISTRMLVSMIQKALTIVAAGQDRIVAVPQGGEVEVAPGREW